ncbi:MAG: putative ABC transporter permease [Atopobiaceae bacterium]|nr:putative ABC transporter permease [Atopobiaceae bacterium]
MIVCQFVVLFVVFSILGWVWESTYCTIIERRWQNRGFLYGPCCPIYGSGVLAIMLLWHAELAEGVVMEWWKVFLFAFFGSMVLEYVTHWTLEKLFHAYWWDYSNMPLNLNGRICLPASIFFGLGGLFVVYVLYEPTLSIISQCNPLLVETLAILATAAIAADTAVTASSLATIARAASSINASINDHMDQFVIGVKNKGDAVVQSISTKRDETAQAITQAAATVVRTKDAVVSTVGRKEGEASQTLARERDRFARSLRASRVGEMSAAVRSAASRAMGAASPDKLPDIPEREQLAELWHDMLRNKS